MGIKDIPIDLPEKEYGLDQLLGHDTGGTSTLATYFATHGMVVVDRVRFRINNIHSNLSDDLEVRLAPGEIILEVRLHAPDPAVRCDGNGYTMFPFIVPIPVGWKDGLCPDINMKDLRATVHLVPALDSSGHIYLKDPKVKLVGDLSLTVGDSLIKGHKAKLLQRFEDQLAQNLSVPATKMAIGKTLGALIVGNKPNAGISQLKIDEGGIEVFF